MPNEEELFNYLENRSDHEIIADHMSLIMDSFEDVLSIYSFILKAKTTELI
jgi:hypothetical protein